MEKNETEINSALPPDEDTLRLHLIRCNYAIYCCLNYKLSEAPPSPTQFGWEIVDHICVPIQYVKPPLPDFIKYKEIAEECNVFNDENGDENITDIEESDSDENDSDVDDV